MSSDDKETRGVSSDEEVVGMNREELRLCSNDREELRECSDVEKNVEITADGEGVLLRVDTNEVLGYTKALMLGVASGNREGSEVSRVLAASTTAEVATEVLKGSVVLDVSSDDRKCVVEPDVDVITDSCEKFVVSSDCEIGTGIAEVGGVSTDDEVRVNRGGLLKTLLTGGVTSGCTYILDASKPM